MNPEGQNQDHRPSPMGRQLTLVGLIAVVLIGMVIVTKSHAKTDEQDSSTNALNPNQRLISKAAAEAIELKTAPVTLQAGEKAIRTNGVVHFSPYNTINVSPRLVGKVRSVFVKVGDKVTAGQVLAEMVSTDAATAVDAARDAEEQRKLTQSALQTARQQYVLGTPEVTAAQATLQQARENTKFMKRALDLTREQSGIGGFTDKPLTDAQSAAKQADTQLAQDLKDLELAQSQRDRTAKLLSYGVAAKADLEAAEDVLGKAKDAVANDREQARIAHQTVDRESKAFKSGLYANQNVSQAETNYQQAVIQEQAAATALSMAKAALVHDLKQAEHDYRAATADARAAENVVNSYDNPTPEGVVRILAPVSGMVTARNINPGQIVDQTGETPWQMLTIVNSGEVYIDVQVYEKDLASVKVGQAVKATSTALPSGYVVHGVISYVSPGLDPSTHALSVRAEVDNKAGLLKDGMFLNATIEVGEGSSLPSHPIVPLTAVVHDGDSDYVFIARGEGKYDRQEVTLGEQLGENQVTILKGLTGKETIVTHGALYLGTGGTNAD